MVTCLVLVVVVRNALLAVTCNRAKGKQVSSLQQGFRKLGISSLQLGMWSARVAHEFGLEEHLTSTNVQQGCLPGLQGLVLRLLVVQ